MCILCFFDACHKSEISLHVKSILYASKISFRNIIQNNICKKDLSITILYNGDIMQYNYMRILCFFDMSIRLSVC